MLQKIWAKWKAFGEMLGNILARVVLSVFYFTIFAPFAIGARIFSDRLEIKTTPDRKSPMGETFWRPRNTVRETLDEAKRQA